MWALDDSIPAASRKEAPRTGLSEDAGLELRPPPPSSHYSAPFQKQRCHTLELHTVAQKKNVVASHSLPAFPTRLPGQHSALLMRTREEGGAPTCGLTATELPPGCRGG